MANWKFPLIIKQLRAVHKFFEMWTEISKNKLVRKITFSLWIFCFGKISSHKLLIWTISMDVCYRLHCTQYTCTDDLVWFVPYCTRTKSALFHDGPSEVQHLLNLRSQLDDPWTSLDIKFQMHDIDQLILGYFPHVKTCLRPSNLAL